MTYKGNKPNLREGNKIWQTKEKMISIESKFSNRSRVLPKPLKPSLQFHKRNTNINQHKKKYNQECDSEQQTKIANKRQISQIKDKLD